MQELGLKRRGTAMNENELLADVATKVADMYDAALADPSPPSGAAFGERVANMLAEDWGGINIYIPKGKNRRLRQRNAQLWAEFTGDNISELARKFGLSEQRAYAIIAEERARRRLRQGTLPGVSLDFPNVR